METEAETLEHFKDAWEGAWFSVYGHGAVRLLPWRQLTIVNDEYDARFSLWMEMTAENVEDLFGQKHNSGFRAWLACRLQNDPGWGMKGIQATAEALWEARGESYKEGLVLCHAFQRSVRRKMESARMYPLASRASDIRLPSLESVGLYDPWHRNSVQMLPEGGIFDTYDNFIAREEPSDKRERIELRYNSLYFRDLTKMALVDFMLGARSYELVRVDLVPSAAYKCGLRRAHPPEIYEHAVQYGDVIERGSKEK